MKVSIPHAVRPWEMHKTLYCLNETLSGDGTTQVLLSPYQVIYKAMAPYWHLTSNLFNIAHISKDVKSTCHML